MAHTTHVFGISGVGKSWLCGRYAERRNKLHVSASGLLRAAKDEIGKSTDAEGLRKGTVLENQDLLIQQFQKVRAEEARDIVLDAHNLIDGANGIVEIPLEVIRGLEPDLIVFVRSDPHTIYDRRKGDTSRERPVRDVETLAAHQDRALALARMHASELGVLLRVVEAGDEASFAEAIDER